MTGLSRKTSVWLVLAALATMTVIGAMLALWINGNRNNQWADADNPRLVALGRTIYEGHCAICHGANLEGQPDWRVRRPDGRLPAPPHDETGHTWHHSDDVLFTITKFGPDAIVAGYESDMPAFENVLSDEEIWAVLAFIKSHWPERERDFQERLNHMAREAEQ